MGSLKQWKRGQDRYFQSGELDIKTCSPKGITARVPLQRNFYMKLFIKWLRFTAGMGYCGASNIEKNY